MKNYFKILFVARYHKYKSSFPIGSLSCWLTNDELEIYYINDFKLFYSSRASITSSFSIPAQVNFVDNIEGYILSPSLTPNKEELYLFNLNIDNNIFKLVETDTLTYKIVDTLDIPSGLLAYPGQLSKDGLKYYVSLKDNFDSVKIYLMERADISSQFENFAVLDNNINFSKRNSQATVTSNDTELVYVSNDENIWWKNNLYIAMNTTSNIDEELDEIIDFISVFPNPSRDNLYINFELSKKAIVNFKIYDLTFRVILSEENMFFYGENQETLDLHELTKGVYILSITVGKKLRTFKFIKAD